MARSVATFAPPEGVLQRLYESLAARYGVQPWWPAETPFEVAVGAVLTQNAAWSNVEQAIERMKAAGLLSLAALLEVEHETLAEAVRPSGYFNIKARRLRNLCICLAEHGGLEGLARLDLATQRDILLGVNGVGPETADDILLYALEQPVFVIDAYTRRLLVRFRLAKGDESYEELRLGFERSLVRDIGLYKQFHALIVIHAKEVCRKSPRCERCGLLSDCPSAPD
jgi:endonuclease-3 related protein